MTKLESVRPQTANYSAGQRTASSNGTQTLTESQAPDVRRALLTHESGKGLAAQAIALQRMIGNRRLSRLMTATPASATRSTGSNLRIQRVIGAHLNKAPLNVLKNQAFPDLSTPTIKGDQDIDDNQVSTLNALLRTTGQIESAAAKYDHDAANLSAQQKKARLKTIVESLQALQEKVDFNVNAYSNRVGQSDADSEAYRVLAGLQSQIKIFAAAVNTEVTQVVGIVRRGPGNRPDANDKDAIPASIGGLGLTQHENMFMQNYVQNPQSPGAWKEQREGLSAIWAKQLGLFNNISYGNPNQYNKDVDYKTTDANKLDVWDQKTMFYDQGGWDARLGKTHKKNKAVGGQGVGLLLDSTFVRSGNYERAWLEINKLVLDGSIPPDAIREVVAPNPQALRAGLFVDMAQHYLGQDEASTTKRNIKWAENKRNGQQQAGLEEIPRNQVACTTLTNILNNTALSHSRYTNNRNWLPDGIYNEYATDLNVPNVGKTRFVVAETGEMYLTVTHYKGFTVKNGQNEVSRNPFYRIP